LAKLEFGKNIMACMALDVVFFWVCGSHSSEVVVGMLVLRSVRVQG
jgi:hypothetical protein